MQRNRLCTCFFRQTRIIRIRPKRRIFGVFSLVVFIRRKPYRILRIKIHTKMALVLGRRFFEERIFCRATSILTRQCEKSVLKKRVWILRACLTENSSRLSTTTMKAEIYPTGTPKYGISRIGKVWRRVNPPPYHISIFFCVVNITDSAGTRSMLCARFLVIL